MGEMESVFTEADREELAARGLDLADAARQLELLREPAARYRELDRPATPGDGIRRLDQRLVPDLLASAAEARREGRVSKFVPASGAATRMFQRLLRAIEVFERGVLDEASRDEVARFLDAIPRLALRHELNERGLLPHDSMPTTDRDRIDLLRRVLLGAEPGLASRPKGLVAFHDAEGRGRTAFEEHLLEAALYAADGDGAARVHLTVPESSRPAFEQLLSRCRNGIESERGVRLDVTFSTQHGSTDTISIGQDGAPFRDEDGKLLFRPGGHGALLGNLQDTSGDIVVIKNIDNVVPPRGAGLVAHWKNLLVGYLATLQQSVHVYLREIHADGNELHWLEQGLAFAGRHLSIDVPRALHRADVARKRSYLVEALDRPIRVCGMVRNEGEPGGGPFWARGEDGSVSLQIVESSEVDKSDPRQASILASATHFNPVDLVVGLRDWTGEPFDLSRFTDPNAMIRTSKTSSGKPLTALERPGLWNGAMANWITVFVEVPIATFAPVKTVFDLLRPEHR